MPQQSNLASLGPLVNSLLRLLVLHRCQGEGTSLEGAILQVAQQLRSLGWVKEFRTGRSLAFPVGVPQANALKEKELYHRIMES